MILRKAAPILAKIELGSTSKGTPTESPSAPDLRLALKHPI